MEKSLLDQNNTVSTFKPDPSLSQSFETFGPKQKALWRVGILEIYYKSLLMKAAI